MYRGQNMVCGIWVIHLLGIPISWDKWIDLQYIYIYNSLDIGYIMGMYIYIYHIDGYIHGHIGYIIATSIYNHG